MGRESFLVAPNLDFFHSLFFSLFDADACILAKRKERMVYRLDILKVSAVNMYIAGVCWWSLVVFLRKVDIVFGHSHSMSTL